MNNILDQFKECPTIEIETKDCELGLEEGDACGQNDCQGEIVIAYPEEDCSCHINPPCSRCTSSYLECNVCLRWLGDEEDRDVESLMGDFYTARSMVQMNEADNRPLSISELAYFSRQMNVVLVKPKPMPHFFDDNTFDHRLGRFK